MSVEYANPGTDIFSFAAPGVALVNPVNCVGVMGAGLALAFKNRYPEMFRRYKVWCDEGILSIGQPIAWDAPTGEMIINFPTKDHWRDRSKLDDIAAGLRQLQKYRPVLANTVVFPAIGCGLGGLDFGDVKKLIEEAFDHYTKLRVIVIPPNVVVAPV